ncbi:aminotransferase class I/II-fold pyridoxal phosphate-dependent enzyme [candidate division FCPU426 bacterium]|nr:aminotransferase class I/II-fold pyridoxal phosphate-dependent enzyme [candidate division FCPU426 bacterium]
MSDPLTPYGNKPMVTPIVNAVNYEYKDFEVLRRITDGEIDGYTYHRDDNPTVRAVEKKIAALEAAEDCIVCTSGMAACTMVYLTYLKAGENLILFHDTYGAHYKVSLILERLGVEVTWLNADESINLKQYIKANTSMVFLETPTNPLCKVIDIAAARRAADIAGARLVVDNTFATPFHQQPLALGAHLVVHSATKALGGHNDLMAGAVAGPKEDYDKLWFTRQAIGCTLDAYSASLLERGLKTFALRAERMAASAMAVAEYLHTEPLISGLFYPGLNGHAGHLPAKAQMRGGFGGMMAFNVGKTQDDAKRFISGLQTIKHAVSLGSTESLICIPYLTTMLYLPPEKRLEFGVKENTVRLSTGVEPPERIMEDIRQALKKV